MELKQIEIDRIKPNPFQPREKFDRGELQELADNIKAHGLIEPIVVTPKGNSFMIVAGERRWRANKLAKQGKVYAIVKDYKSDVDIKRDSLVENEMRQNLSNEEFRAFTFALAESLGEPYYKKGWINSCMLATYVGPGPDSSFRRKLDDVLKVFSKNREQRQVSEKVKEFVEEGRLDIKTAAKISEIKDKKIQDKIADIAKEKTTGEIRKEVQKVRFEQEQKIVHETLKKKNEETENKRKASEEMWLNKIQVKIDSAQNNVNYNADILKGINNKSFLKKFSNESQMELMDTLKPLRRDVERFLHIITKIMETLGGN